MKRLAEKPGSLRVLQLDKSSDARIMYNEARLPCFAFRLHNCFRDACTVRLEGCGQYAYCMYLLNWPK